MTSEYQGRLVRLQHEIRSVEAEFAVLGPTDQMRYIAGWATPGHERLIALFIPRYGEPVFVVPAMNAPEAAGNPAGFERVIAWDDATGWLPAVQSLLGEWRAGHGTGLVDDELWAGHLLDMQQLFAHERWASAGPVMTLLRQIKSSGELEAMAAAGGMIDEIVEEVATGLKEGISELEAAEAVLSAIKQRGSRPSFSPLVCFGANAALPHHHPDETRLRRGDVVIIDIGSTSGGYPSDITRTFSFGVPSDPDAAAIYDIVSQAHWAAREAAKPGVTGEQVDAAARKVITDAGYGEQFIHRTGHGIGLSTHEPPNIVAGNTAPLQPGMCFSIEPGIYLPGRFGVRIENIVSTTESGLRSFNSDPPRTLRVL
jgi:Xaa-Pro aminopeptidase